MKAYIKKLISEEIQSLIDEKSKLKKARVVRQFVSGHPKYGTEGTALLVQYLVYDGLSDNEANYLADHIFCDDSVYHEDDLKSFRIGLHYTFVRINSEKLNAFVLKHFLRRLSELNPTTVRRNVRMIIRLIYEYDVQCIELPSYLERRKISNSNGYLKQQGKQSQGLPGKYTKMQLREQIISCMNNRFTQVWRDGKLQACKRSFVLRAKDIATELPLGFLLP